MVRWKAQFMTRPLWLLDPETRERAAFLRAKRKGIRRMKRRLLKSLAEGDTAGVLYNSDQLQSYVQVINAIPPLALDPSPPQQAKPTHAPPTAPPAEPRATPTYLVSSATLAQAYVYLTQDLAGVPDQPEWMLAVTGVELAEQNLRSLEQLIAVKLAYQSPMTAAFDMRDFARVAIRLDEHGQALHAIFHSHRFDGPPNPSHDDWRLQRSLEQGGYPAIQAIFSEDGYIRFFAKRCFHVKVSGKGVEHADHDTFLYRLVQFGTLPHPGHPAAA